MYFNNMLFSSFRLRFWGTVREVSEEEEEEEDEEELEEVDVFLSLSTVPVLPTVCDGCRMSFGCKKMKY